MHITPLHFTVNNESAQIDFLGYLKYQRSRRNKEAVRVYFCNGGDMEYITEIQLSLDDMDGHAYFDYDHTRMMAIYLNENGYMEEYLAVENYELTPETDYRGKTFDEKVFMKLLADNKITLRFW